MRRTASIAVLTLVGLLLTPAADAATPTCAGRPATIVGTDGSDRVSGTDGDDVVHLGAGRDFYEGSGGDDLVCLGDGGDHASLRRGTGTGTVYGGSGNDSLFAAGEGVTFHGEAGDDEYQRRTDDPGADRVFGGPGTDAILVRRGTASFDVGGGVGHGADNIVEFALPTRVGLNLRRHTWSFEGRSQSFGAGRIVVAKLDRSLGADLVIGDDRNESVEIGGGDTVSMRGGSDSVEVTTPGAATAALGAGSDEFYAEDGDVTVRAGWGDDYLGFSARAGGTVDGDDGADEIFFLGHARVDVHGGAGRDEMGLRSFSRGVRADLAGGRLTTSYAVLDLVGVEDFAGTGGDDVVRGTAGPNRLSGGGGDDRLYGGAGPDRGYGGGGDDVCFGVEQRFSCTRG